MTTHNPGGLPYGSGSLQKRGLKWWAIYMDANGVKIQVSTKTDDLDEARRFLAARALEVARARVAALESIVNGETKQPVRKPRRNSAGTGRGDARAMGRSGRLRAGGAATRPKGRA
jgi:hypothetical protein